MKKIKSPLSVGQNVFIRTVTYHYTGRVVGITESEILLDGASWIADSGRWAAAQSNGTLNEVEPYAPGVVSISRASVVDVSSWRHPLPLVQK